MAKLRVLIIGDVVGASGRSLFQKYVRKIKEEYAIDAVIVNGENSAHGKGITPKIAHFFKHNGADVITTGNHIWAQREIYPYLDEHTDVLRPANFSPKCPGVGVTTFQVGTHTIGVINVQGRTFMPQQLDCPFVAVDSLLLDLQQKTNLIFVDFHAEATSEKLGLAYYLDGRVSGVVGTHTHVQTADNRVLPNGTAYITDLGMCGSLNSMLGMKKEPLIDRFMTQMPVRFDVDDAAPYVLSGVWIEVDTDSGRATDIQRIYIVDTQEYLN